MARLHADPAFRARIAEQFEGDYTLKFHLAPPIFSKIDAVTGRGVKHSYGQWMLTAMKLLRHGKRLRGTPFDLFGRTDERRNERAMINEYEDLIDDVLNHMTRENFDTAVALAELPMSIRGYGVVKDKSIKQANLHKTELLAALRGHVLKPVAVIRPAS